MPARPAVALALLVAVLSNPAHAEDKWARHWTERVEAFRRENEALPAGRKNAVFVGDSMTEGFRLAEAFPGRAVLNRGVTADQIGVVGERGILRRLDESVFDTNPSVVFLMIGVNDLAASPRAPEFFVEGFGKLVDAIRERLPDLPIVVQTCLPAGEKYARHATLNPRIEAYNEGLRELAQKRGLTLVDVGTLYRGLDGLLPADLTSDGLHLKREAFAKWADAVRPHITE